MKYIIEKPGFLFFASWIVVVSVLLSVADISQSRFRMKHERNTIRFLREYGDAQYAYNTMTRSTVWGSWDTLQAYGFLDASYDRNSSFPYYTIFTNEQNVLPYGGGCGANASTFTAVAFPANIRRQDILRTFIIRHDHIVRVYNPVIPGTYAWGEDGDFGGLTWTPVSQYDDIWK